MNNNQNSFDIDVAFTARQKEREKQAREEQEAKEKVRQKERGEVKMEYDVLVGVKVPECEQGQVRVNQNLAEELRPEEEEVKKNIIAAAGLAFIAAIIGLAGFMLMFVVLEPVFYMLPPIVRIVVAVAVIAAMILALHWALQYLSARMRKIVIFSLFFIAVVTFVLFAFLRGEYTRAKADQGQMTAAQAAQRSEQLDWIVAISQLFLGLTLEFTVGLAGSKAAERLSANWVHWKLYRRRQYWEQVYAKLLERKIELENKLETLEVKSQSENKRS